MQCCVARRMHVRGLVCQQPHACPHSRHTQGPGDVRTRAHPQEGEVFLSNSSFSGLRSPLAQSWDSTNRVAATRPALSTTVGDRQMGMGEGMGGAPPSSQCMGTGVYSLSPPQGVGVGGLFIIPAAARTP